MKVLVSLFSLILILNSCSENSIQKDQINESDSYKIKSYEVGHEEWGFDILMDNKMIIHQPLIPAVTGNRGFKSEYDAMTTASFMIEKLRKGMTPPTISTQELDSLGVLNP